MFVMAFLCFGVCVCLPPYPDRVDTMLSPLRSLLDVADLASQSHSLLVLLVFCFVLVACLCLFFVCVGFLFVCCLFAVALLVTAVGTMYRSMPVQLLRLLSELIGAATESAAVNRDRAPSGPVKVVVTNQPHSRPNAGIDLASGVSALLAWFPASWASKVAPCFIGDAGGATQLPQEVTIQCPTREAADAQSDDGVLQAVKFTDKRVPGLCLDLDGDLQAAGCFTEAIRGYQMEVVEPDVMRGLQPAGATRVTLDVIIPSPTGLTPEKWK